MKKLIKIFLIVVITFCLIIAITLKFGAYLFVDSGLKNDLISVIEESEDLPDRFYDLYELAYPNSINNHSHLSLFFNNLLGKRKNDCPCGQVAYMSPYNYGWQKVLFTFHLEGYVSQKQCLNLLVNKMDFLYGNLGINSASSFYYNKKLKDLSSNEMLELILMMDNPSFYNKLKRPEMLKKKVDELLKNK